MPLIPSIPTIDYGLSEPVNVSQWFTNTLRSQILFAIEPSVVQCAGKLKREQEFAAGRNIAEEQLRKLGHSNPHNSIGVNPDRSPNWPEGFVGSISHSDHWTIAAVAKQEDVRSIGIDTEPIANASTVRELQREIATYQEWANADAMGLTPEEVFTVVFSAKEAFYKCCYPITQNYFGFEDATIEFATQDRVVVCNSRSNPNVGHTPDVLEVFFLIEGKDVFTATSMRHQE